MREWRFESRRFASGLSALASAVLSVSVLASASVSAAPVNAAAAAAVNASTAPAAEAGVPPATEPMPASELFALYKDKSWRWTDGAGRMESADRRFTAWVDGEKGKSWAEGRWLVTDGGRMCFKATWHSDQGAFPETTCFLHRIGNGTIYQRQEPDGAWFVFRSAKKSEDDEAAKLESVDLVSGQIISLKPVDRPKQSTAKQKDRK